MPRLLSGRRGFQKKSKTQHACRIGISLSLGCLEFDELEKNTKSKQCVKRPSVEVVVVVVPMQNEVEG